MPEIFPTTSYGWIVSDLRDIVTDLEKIATETTETITQVEAELCHHHLYKILKSLILSTRLARRRWPAACPRTPSSVTSRSHTETSTDSPSHYTNGAS